MRSRSILCKKYSTERDFCQIFTGSVHFAKPALRSVPDVLGYDTVVLGAPVWAGKPAAPLNTLLSEVDFSGKRVAAFASSAGGSAQKMLSLIAERVRNAEVFATASFKNPARSPDAAGELIAAFAEKILGNA